MSILSRIKQIKHKLFSFSDSAKLIEQLMINEHYDKLRTQSRYHDPKSLIPYGYKVYSQNDEDGIINEIFNRIGTTNKTFVEFGIGDGLENNTHALLFNGWKGLWIDANHKAVKEIQANYYSLIKSDQLTILESFITLENINKLIKNNIKETNIDLLSVDIDGNDFHILTQINCIKPRVIVTEYNAKFHPPIMYCMNYNGQYSWQGNDCFGASLKFLEVELAKRDYALVGCNLSGANAFFVRSDLLEDKFLSPYTAEKHYEPARYYLSSLESGHPASYKTLKNKF